MRLNSSLVKSLNWNISLLKKNISPITTISRGNDFIFEYDVSKFPPTYISFGNDYTDKNGKIKSNSYEGVCVSNSCGIEYSIGVIGHDRVVPAGGLGIDGGAWARIGKGTHFGKNYGRWYELPEEKGQSSACVALYFTLEPGEIREIPFLLTWYAPKWNSGGRYESEGNMFHHY